MLQTLLYVLHCTDFLCRNKLPDRSQHPCLCPCVMKMITDHGPHSPPNKSSIPGGSFLPPTTPYILVTAARHGVCVKVVPVDSRATE